MLEYTSAVWNLWLLQDITMLENVHRSFTSKVSAVCNLPALTYEKCLSLFGLEKLELRRLKVDLVEMFKIINNFFMSSLKNVIKFANDRPDLHNTRGHRFKLVKLTSHKNCFKYYFSNRIFDAWNFYLTLVLILILPHVLRIS